MVTSSTQLLRHNIKQIVTTNLIFINNYALLIAFYSSGLSEVLRAVNLVMINAVKIGKNIIPAAAKATDRTCPIVVTATIFDPTVVTSINDHQRAFQ